MAKEGATAQGVSKAEIGFLGFLGSAVLWVLGFGFRGFRVRVYGFRVWF